ncbi:MAG: hypothetical protein WCX82_02990 [archaeon]|jgi:hypothetical protein
MPPKRIAVVCTELRKRTDRQKAVEHYKKSINKLTTADKKAIIAEIKKDKLLSNSEKLELIDLILKK